MKNRWKPSWILYDWGFKESGAYLSYGLEGTDLLLRRRYEKWGLRVDTVKFYLKAIPESTQ